MAGAALGLALAALGTDVLIKMAGRIPRIEDVQMNGMVLAFTGAVAILTGIAVGLVPAMSSWRAGLVTAMQEGGRSATAGRSGGVFRDVLVAAEVALSLMLLIGAGLMLKSFSKLQTVDAGFNPDRVLTIQFSLPSKRYDKKPRVAQFYEDLIARVNSMQGVEGAGLVTMAPLAGHWSDTTFTIEGRPPLAPGQFMDALIRSADPGYFKAMGIPLKRGRFFTPADRLEQANKSIISESMAKEFFPNEDPIGKRLNLGDDAWREIVGIVGDVRKEVATEPQSTMYFPYATGGTTMATLMVRAKGDPNLLSLPLQQTMRSLDADLPAVTVKTMDEIRGDATQQSRFGLSLIGLFAGLAVVLASIGLYGVLAYSVGQRTNELGIRIALGAAPPDITRLIVWQGMKPAAIGIVAGVLGGLAATRWLASMLFEVKPNDPAVMISVALLIAMIAILASYVPAWRATKIDPMVALRAE
jgi:predicted permease